MQTPFKTLVLSGLAIGMLVAAWWGADWLMTRQRHVSTDNAYLRADITAIAAQVPGNVIAVAVDDNAEVDAGDVLFRIDDRDYQARMAQADARLAAARAALSNLSAQRHLQESVIDQARARIRSVNAAQVLAQQTRDRQRALVETRATSQARLDQSEAAAVGAEAAVVAAHAEIQAQTRRLDVIAAQEEAAQATLAQAEAARQLARINLDNTIVRAPVAGIVGNRQVQAGRFVAAGAPMLDIVPVQDIWVEANFKETQLARLETGQQVEIRVDGYPDRRLAGRVDSLAPGSGAAFSLLPPDNATGNFIRIVQRVPVKIRLMQSPEDVRLVPGMSARVRVDLAGREPGR